MAIVALLAPVAPASAADVVVGFDDLAPGTVVKNQYHAQGIDLGRSPSDPSGNAGELPKVEDVGAAGAHSGTRVAALAPCGTEFCSDKDVWVKLGLSRHSVSVYVGGGFNGTVVRLAAYRANGTQITSVTKTVGQPAQTLLQVSSLLEDIAFIRIGEVAAVSQQRAPLRLDDLTFNAIDPANPPKPDFGIVRDLSANLSPTGDVDIVKGKSTSVKIIVNRVNNASGSLKYTVSGLPAKVASSFQPSSVTGASTVTLQLNAAQDAPTGDATVKVTADPQGNAQAGVAPRSLTFPFHILGNFDLEAQGIEVTQGIQRQLQPCFTSDSCASLVSLPNKPLDNPKAAVNYQGVLLVEHGVTVVRFFADVKSPANQTVGGATSVLRGFRAGKELPGSPLLSSQKTLSNGLPWVTFPERADPAQGFTFTLPDSWTQGNVTLKAEVVQPEVVFLNQSSAECETQACKDNNGFTLANIAFGNTGHIELSPVRLYTHPDNYFDAVEPFPRDVFAEAENIAPLAPGRLIYDSTGYYGSIDISDLTTVFSDADSIRAQDSDIADRLEDWMDDYPACKKRNCADQTVGVYTNVGFGLSRGKLLEGDEPVSVVESTKPFNSVAHELAHGWGRPHASFCGGGGSNGQVAELWPPDGQGFIQGVGLDRRLGSGGAPEAPFRVFAPGALGAPPGVVGGGNQPGQWFDFMSYCASSPWISTKGWDDEVSFLNAIEIFNSHPNASNAVARASAGPTLRVRGFVNADGSVAINSVKPGGGRAIGSATGSIYRLVVRNAAGGVVSDTPMKMRAGHVAGLGTLIYLSVEAAAAGAAKLEIVRDGVVVATRSRSAHAPRVRVLAPKRGARVGRKRTTTIRWRAIDADNDRLTVKVDYSRDDGRHFTPIFIGPDRGRAALPSELLAGSRRARVRVRANDGFNEALAVSGRFSAVGRPPHPRIIAPLGGATIAADGTLVLVGQALDDTHRVLPGSRLRWLDGRRVLGVGAQIAVNGLVPGRRRIRLVARDRQGRSGTASVSVRVFAVRPRFLDLRVPKRVSRRARTFTLRLSATVPSILTAPGGRHNVDRRLRRIAVRVRPGRTALSLRLRLAAGRRAIALAISVPRR